MLLYIRKGWLTWRPLILGDIEFLCESLGQDLTDVFARAALPVLLWAVQVPVRAVKFPAGAFLASFLAAFDAFQSEVAFVACLLAGRRDPAIACRPDRRSGPAGELPRDG